MCGIAGIVDAAMESDPGGLREAVSTMTASLHHRGPDDSATWVDDAAGVALGHRRLSIIDLSEHGRQPMSSACGRYALVYNGEVYNFIELRRRLVKLGHHFRGNSDTEVLLNAIVEWGVEGAVAACNGMFAFALWDRYDRRLHLVRDRLGEKPLYYGWSRRVFLFGSELKALKAHPAFNAGVDREALALYLRHNCVPAPWSIYQGIRKLPPASILTLNHGSTVAPEPRAYWSAAEVAKHGAAEPLQLDEDQAADALQELLSESVRLRMTADVPVGAFLSGGIDSSTVVAFMQMASERPVKTFTIGSTDPTFDESENARTVARHLGTDHTELRVTPSKAIDIIPRLPSIYDEPFGDSSQIPTLLVAELARRHVIVSLSGDGGDEVFGGYNRYKWIPRLWRNLGWLPMPVRHGLAKMTLRVPHSAWDLLVRPLPRRFRPQIASDKARKIAKILPSHGPAEMYRGLTSHWINPENVVLRGREPTTAISDPGAWPDDVAITRHMMLLDTVSYLPDDILVKLDRATMAVGLEARVPLIDHRLIEFTARLPTDQVTKRKDRWLLRKVLYRHVPRALVERPKAGFGVPISAWLRGPLRPWAEELLDRGTLARDGYFRPEPIREAWDDHVTRGIDRQGELWDVLMFQAWLHADRL